MALTKIVGSGIDSTTDITLNDLTANNVTVNDTQIDSLGVGTAASSTTGEIRATNDVTAFYSSDKSFKENIQDIKNPLDIVNAIGSKTWNWTEKFIESKGGEDVQKVFPEAVIERDNGTLAVDYQKLAILSFGAIQELTKRIEKLERGN